MSVLNDLMDALPEAGGMLKNFDLSSVLERLPSLGELLDPIELLSKVDLSGIVANVGEAALDFLGGLPIVRNAG